jgi:hypothetical protein
VESCPFFAKLYYTLVKLYWLSFQSKPQLQTFSGAPVPKPDFPTSTDNTAYSPQVPTNTDPLEQIEPARQKDGAKMDLNKSLI